jgi:hypothetical protein
MSEARFENVLRELRDAAPPAPEQLRKRVGALPEPLARGGFRLRPALVAAAAIGGAVAVGAAAIGGFQGASSTQRENAEAGKILSGTRSQQRAKPANKTATGSARAGGLQAYDRGPLQLGSVLAPGSRLQNYEVAMSARVDDLSDATKSAVRTTRKLGGYVAAADYATGQSAGDSRLDLRVPVQNVQRAIGSLTELGTILSQRISVADLQATVDRFEQRRSMFRQVIAELEAKQRTVGLTPSEQKRLDGAKRTVARLSEARARLVRQGTYAKISLTLTTRKPIAKHSEPGRFGRFWGDAGDILGKEAIIVLYALVVAGPFVLLAALALLAERARRRRADSLLLKETA